MATGFVISVWYMIDIIELIENKYSSFSKSHKKIADYILINYEKAVFMTADKLGKVSGTSEATVVRFAATLGFSKYGDFQKELSLLISDSLDKKKNISHRVKIGTLPDNLKAVFEKDIVNLQSTIEGFDFDIFADAIDTIISAKNVYIIGLRECEMLASVLATYLNLSRPNVHLVTSNATNEIFEQLVHINQDDVLISFGFPNYSVRTIKAMEYANVNKARIVSITDSIYSPMSMYTSLVLTAKCELTDDISSLTAAMSLVNAMIVSIIQKSDEKYKQSIKQLYDANESIT